jgi:hypothetical protein
MSAAQFPSMVLDQSVQQDDSDRQAELLASDAVDQCFEKG